VIDRQTFRVYGTSGQPRRAVSMCGSWPWKSAIGGILLKSGSRGIMSDWQPAPYRDYQWIVADPQLLGGKLAIRGTRLSVSLILECLAAGMSLEDIDQAFDRAFPHEAMPEVLKVAAELTNSVHVAA
jgi:uncharacterized protein (DUF433 family)